jgi:hypothetical protein
VGQDLWHLQGWNTFAASYNPLWVAALALTFVTLTPLLRPGGPSGAAEAATLGLGLLALVAVHPYSAIVVLAVAVIRPVLACTASTRPARRCSTCSPVCRRATYSRRPSSGISSSPMALLAAVPMNPFVGATDGRVRICPDRPGGRLSESPGLTS